MGRDHNGQLHAGTVGLFDDPDEIAASERREMNAREKEEVRIEKALRKDDNRGQRTAEKANRKRLKKEQGLSWWRRHFNVHKTSEHKDETPASKFKAPPAVPQWTINAQHREKQKEKERAGEKRKQTEMEMFDAQDIDDLNSPFYQELGLVLVKGETSVDNRVVHKSQIRNHTEEDSDDEGSVGW